MTAPTVRIGDIAQQIRGVTFDKSESRTTPSPGYLPVLRAGNIRDAGLSFDDLVYVPVGRIRDKQLLRRNDVVVAASSGSLDVVGKAARSLGDYARCLAVSASAAAAASSSLGHTIMYASRPAAMTASSSVTA